MNGKSSINESEDGYFSFELNIFRYMYELYQIINQSIFTLPQPCNSVIDVSLLMEGLSFCTPHQS